MLSSLLLIFFVDKVENNEIIEMVFDIKPIYVGKNHNSIWLKLCYVKYCINNWL